MINTDTIVKFQDGENHKILNNGTSASDSKLNIFPYHSKLSFVSIIEYWKEKLDSSEIDQQIIAKEVFQRLEQLPEFKEPIEDLSLLETHQDFVKLLLSGYFPSIQRELSLGAAHQPFVMKPFYVTPAMRRLMESKKLSICFDVEKEVARNMVIVKMSCLILNRHYGQNIELDPSFIYSFELEDTSLLGFYKTEKLADFLQVIPVKPLKKISQEQINQMLSNIYDVDLWLNLLPPDHFEFHGVTLEQLFDITEEETLSRMKYKLLEKDALILPKNIAQLESSLKTYFRQPDLKMGITALDYPSKFTVAHQYKIRHNFLAKKYESIIIGENHDSLYGKACHWKEILIIEDLKNYMGKTKIPQELLKLGFQSIIVAPLFNKDKRVIGLLEIAAPKSFQLTSFDKIKLKDVVPLFSMSLERSREEVDNKIEAILREEYTTLHPSVEWKFIDGAFKIMEQREIDPTFSEVETIAFKDVFPLYGQADIVGSSNRRNLSIQTDLLDNLNRVKALLDIAQHHIFFPLLDQKKLHVEQNIKSIEKGISSDDESRIIDFIRNEIHPLLREVKDRHIEVQPKIVSYFNQLDPALGIVYKDRKLYENSVAMINETISDCLMKAEKMGQEMIPHYFNEYKTDGVEYDIYVGQSLLKNGEFNNIQLRNLRLWQLLTMVTVTRKVHALKSKMQVPLDTAQLIFVYGNPLSIRFRLDEKRFDVDGAYNVRYEIIKKRIDKAYIEGTKERLTVKGKIAIVYTSEKDKIEYLDYLKYLREKKFIEDEIEDLALSKMQGVEGLKALRVTVVM